MNKTKLYTCDLTIISITFTWKQCDFIILMNGETNNILYSNLQFPLNFIDLQCD